jgi:DNA polymerase III delta prime subunit
MTTYWPEALKSEKIPNPLLLVGATQEHAIALCKQLLGDAHIPKINSGNHPDLHLIEPEKKSHLHPVASIRQIIAEMGMPPFQAPQKIFLILEAEKMLSTTANTLLKTLEEPAADTWFILVTKHPDRLLPTVMSRLSPVQFSGFDPRTADLSSLLTSARGEDWDEVLDLLETLDGEDPNAIFYALVKHAASRKDSTYFSKIASHIEEGRKALEHNMKLKTVVLNILLHQDLLDLREQGLPL